MTAAELKASILDRAVRGELTAAWRAECEAKGEVERRETRDARGRETRDTPPSDVSRLTSSPAVSSLASRVSRPTPGPTPIADPPYDLPQGWVWKRLGDICSKIVDGDHNPPKGIEGKTQYLMLFSRNINDGTLVDLSNVRYLTRETFEIEDQRTKARKGDIHA